MTPGIRYRIIDILPSDSLYLHKDKVINAIILSTEFGGKWERENLYYGYFTFEQDDLKVFHDEGEESFCFYEVMLQRA